MTVQLNAYKELLHRGGGGGEWWGGGQINGIAEFFTVLIRMAEWLLTDVFGFKLKQNQVV